MTKNFTIRDVMDTDIEALSALAHRIWHQHYPAIISVEQIDYMLDLWYQPVTLRQQLAEPERAFLLAEINQTPVAYIAASPQDGHRFIHKLYVEDACRGMGIGQQLIRSVACGLPLKLRVNRDNTHSIAFYQKLDFHIIAEDVLSIGKGYIMDDYIMRKEVLTA